MYPIVSDLQSDVAKYYRNNQETSTYTKYMNPDYRETFKTTLIIALGKNFSLEQIIGTNMIINNKNTLTQQTSYLKENVPPVTVHALCAKNS